MMMMTVKMDIVLSEAVIGHQIEVGGDPQAHTEERGEALIMVEAQAAVHIEEKGVALIMAVLAVLVQHTGEIVEVPTMVEETARVLTRKRDLELNMTALAAALIEGRGVVLKMAVDPAAVHIGEGSLAQALKMAVTAVAAPAVLMEERGLVLSMAVEAAGVLMEEKGLVLRMVVPPAQIYLTLGTALLMVEVIAPSMRDIAGMFIPISIFCFIIFSK